MVRPFGILVFVMLPRSYSRAIYIGSNRLTMLPMRKHSSDNELRSRALAGARRAAGKLHAHEQELSSRPEYQEGADLARSAAEAADRVARLLEKFVANPDNQNINPS